MKYKCLCCGYRTLEERGGYDICPVCYWEDDAYLIIAKDSIRVLKRPENYFTDEYNGEDVLDMESGANHGLTLRQGRENFKAFGACEKSMVEYVRKPKKCEMESE